MLDEHAMYAAVDADGRPLGDADLDSVSATEEVYR